MREPRGSYLKIDKNGTAKIRCDLVRHRGMKITMNVDTKSLQALKVISRRTGRPSHGLVRRVLQDGVRARVNAEARLDRLERGIDEDAAPPCGVGQTGLLSREEPVRH